MPLIKINLNEDPQKPNKITETIIFRLIVTPCCGQMLCWVNHRLPNYCPECGSKVFVQLKMDNEREHFKIWDEQAELIYHDRKY